jgi:hypothetical protein
MRTFEEYTSNLASSKMMLQESLSRINADLISLVKEGVMSPFAYNEVSRSLQEEFDVLLRRLS